MTRRPAASRNAQSNDADIHARAGQVDHPSLIDCETTVRRLWDFLDGGVSAMVRREVEAHLATCADCTGHFDFAALTLTTLAAMRAGVLSTHDDTVLRAKLRHALVTAGI
ncbi:MAG TPA: zf-HC2 domain-containing protein [Gemmatimonadaceae bacterium]|nr:zf-HC2 domain-containing protein [Gemmatimonadaceae bacterium]